MNRDRSVYIRYIYDCICKIEEYTIDGRDDFFKILKLKMQLSVI